MKSDAELLASAGHDPDAFRQLYDRYAEPVHGFLFRRTSNRDAALDLTAETFAQVWTSRHTFEDQRDGSAGPWIFGIAGHVLARSAREQRLIREASEALRLRREPLSVVPDTSWVDGMEADLEQALAELPDAQRRAVELRVLSDRSYDELAEELDCSPTAARIRVSRGLSRLRTTTPSLATQKELS
ncbi:sigma-70 family RNA polymerase sigma factor [Aeromicrobium panaciterrae]